MSLGRFWARLHRFLSASKAERDEPQKPRPWGRTYMLHGEVHVYPMDDLSDHILLGLLCACGPRRSLRDDRFVLHNAYDGRDIIEAVEAGLPP